MWPPKLAHSTNMTKTLFVLIAASLAAASATAQTFHFAHEGVLGTSYAVHVSVADEARAAQVNAKVLAEVRRLEEMLSGYRSDSEFSRFLREGKSERLSRELLQVLQACDQWGERTNGAFHAAFAEAAGARYDAGAPATSTYRSPWTIETDKSAAILKASSKVGIDGLAKGYVIDRACDAAMRCDGVRGVTIDIGGDIRVAGDVQRMIEVANPKQPADNAPPLFSLKIRDLAVATSGSYARPVAKKNGEGTESHIRDPRTGAAVTGISSVTVIASACVDADALATALHVKTPAAGLAMIESMPGYECVIVEAAGAVHASSGVAGLTGAQPVPNVAMSTAGLEVSLSFEILKPETKSRRSYRRPYVAVWIEDEEGNDVRTLALWIERQRWLRDLRKWYRIHRRDKDLIASVSRATRRPGAYELVWNGKSNDGEDLPTGNYVLCMEVAREHGTHQMMRAPFRTEADQTVTMESNVEVGGATVSVRRRDSGDE